MSQKQTTLPAASGGRVENMGFEVIGKKGEGTFSEVLTCRLADGRLAAVKRMKSEFRSWEQVNSLREVQALRRLNPHPNIINLLDVRYDPGTRRLDLICEMMDMNIYERIKNRKHHLPEALVKSYIYQLCKSLDHMHRNGIFHRDIKPENILIRDDVLKLADFGSCRGIYSKPPFTEYISTRWYRPPECLLTDGRYSFKMDMWSVGCVFFEVMSLYPLFPGQNEVDQLSKIHDVVGVPSDELLAKIQKGSNHTKHRFEAKAGTGLQHHLPHASAECLELMEGLLKYDPEERYSARQALKHPYFREQREADKRLQQRQQTVVQDQMGSSATLIGGMQTATLPPANRSGAQAAKKKLAGREKRDAERKARNAAALAKAKERSLPQMSQKATTTSSSSISTQQYSQKGKAAQGGRRRRGKQQPQSMTSLANQAKAGGPGGFSMTTRGYGPSTGFQTRAHNPSSKAVGGGGGGGGDAALPKLTFSIKTNRKPKLAKSGNKSSYSKPGGMLPKLGKY